MCPRPMCLFALLCAALFSIAGCGGSDNNCRVIGLNVTPQSAVANHTAAAPANSQTFSAANLFGGGGGVCTANTAALVRANWTVSDPSVQLSAPQATQVTATCTAGLASPVTITATDPINSMMKGQASLTCN